MPYTYYQIILTFVISARLTLTLAAEPPAPVRLPGDVPPVIGCWFWRDNEFAPGGYRPFLDMVADHAAYNLLTASLRAPAKEVTDDDVHDQIKKAAAYARKRGMGVLMDLDVRLARKAFQKVHPDELQEMLRLREIDLPDAGTVTLRVTSQDLSDHYTFRTTHYIPLAGRLVRTYSYVRTPEGIDPDTVRDITRQQCKVNVASAKEVSVIISCGDHTRGRKACALVAFTHFTPAVFAPHLIEFQRNIIERYADVDLAGACKDEWGFPPCFDGCPAKNDFWFSTFRAAAYAKRTGGRDLLRDALLMTFPHQGQDRQRQAAINHFMEMSTLRNGRIEDAFYHATKAVFGPFAVPATHPTWWPFPGTREFKKNGLHWWKATRDLAQTDEVTPYCVRTSLAKKWSSPLWYNMYYSPNLGDYKRSLWAGALAGGRINYHPLWPVKGETTRYAGYEAFLRGRIMRGDCRIRLLNFIAKTPLDCPVAVIFGHACAMNWAGSAYNDVGIELADALWRAGYPTDLIPSSEVASNTFRISQDGTVQYGPQPYAAVVLYQPEFERPQTAAFFRKAAKGKTALYRVGDWTTDFDGKPFDGNVALPKQMRVLPDTTAATSEMVAFLGKRGIEPQAPARETAKRFGYRSSSPPPKGLARLIDGTRIIVSGAENVSGDPIQATFEIGGHKVTVDAVGVIGVRLGQNGQVKTFAAGGLKRFQVGSFKIVLPRRADLAFWIDEAGTPRGVLQDWTGPVPQSLARISQHWIRLAVPAPLHGP